MLRSYVLAPDTLRRTMRTMFWRFQAIVTLSFLGLGYFLTRPGERINWGFVLPMIGLIALAYFLIIFFYFRQQLRLLYSIRYEVDGTGIIYRQIGQPPLRISRADVKTVREHKNGLMLETLDPAVSLLIMRGLAHSGDRELRTLLNTWSPIQPAEPAKNKPWLALIFTGAAAALIVVFVTSNLWIIVPLVVLLLAFAIYSQRELQRIPAENPGMAKMYSFALSFLVFVAVIKSILVAVNFFLPH